MAWSKTKRLVYFKTKSLFDNQGIEAKFHENGSHFHGIAADSSIIKQALNK